MDPIPGCQSRKDLVKSRPNIGLVRSKAMLLPVFKEGHPSSRPLKLAGVRHSMTLAVGAPGSSRFPKSTETS